VGRRGRAEGGEGGVRVVLVVMMRRKVVVVGGEGGEGGGGGREGEGVELAAGREEGGVVAERLQLLHYPGRGRLAGSVEEGGKEGGREGGRGEFTACFTV